MKEDPLKDWLTLNAWLKTAKEKDCKRVLDVELAGRCRTQFVLRLYSRMNVLRARRERTELFGKVRGAL